MNIRSAKTSFRQRWFTLFLLTVSCLHIFPSIVLAATSFKVRNLTSNNPVTAGYTQFSNIQLNDAGQAVFTGVNPSITDPEGHPRRDVFFWNGTTLQNVTVNIPGFVASNQPNLNNNGQVAFTGSTNFNGFESLPFFYNGTSVQNLAAGLNLPLSAANFFHAIAINDLGQVAFAGAHETAFSYVSPHQVFLFTGTQMNLLCDECSFGSLITDLSINNRGHVAWSDNQSG